MDKPLKHLKEQGQQSVVMVKLHMQAMKAYGRVEVQLHSLHLAVKRSKWPASCLNTLPPGETIPVSIQ